LSPKSLARSDFALTPLCAIDDGKANCLQSCAPVVLVDGLSQASVYLGARRHGKPQLIKHANRIELACRLDDASQNQLLEGLIGQLSKSQ